MDRYCVAVNYVGFFLDSHIINYIVREKMYVCVHVHIF